MSQFSRRQDQRAPGDVEFVQSTMQTPLPDALCGSKAAAEAIARQARLAAPRGPWVVRLDRSLGDVPGLGGKRA